MLMRLSEARWLSGLKTLSNGAEARGLQCGFGLPANVKKNICPPSSVLTCFKSDKAA